MRIRRLLALSLLLPACLAVSAQTRQSRKTTTCANCHETETLSQPATQMGRAMELPGANTVLNAHPRLTFRKDGYSYSVLTQNGHSRYVVSDGKQTITLPIVWAMGAQAQTWVLERNGKLLESLVSYYPAIQGLQITTGDERIAPKSIEEAIGRPVGADEEKACFNCHATHAVEGQQVHLQSLQPGVGCEHCHSGAAVHAAKMMATGDMSSVPPRLSQLSSEEMSNFCGQCHRTWETVVRSHWRGQANVRFQPYRLANSKCFNGADPRIGCVGCHNPHEQVVHDMTYYDGKCLACHGQASVATAASVPHPKTCPVAKSQCVSCHMPKLSLPNGLLRFTDHQIRIVKQNEPYPN